MRNINIKECLAHHDVVFRAPVCDFSYGLPIGNGSSGCLLWLSEDTLHVQINHTDLIDDVAEGETYCQGTCETAAVCRNGAKLDIHFQAPVFETIYQNRFEARLSLAEAAAHIEGETPFAKTKIRAFSSEKQNVTVLSIDTNYQEGTSMRAELSRWGSRTFMYWYGQFRDNTSIGLDGTESFLEEGCMCIAQKLKGNNFCIAVKPVTGAKFEQKVTGSHGSETSFANCEFAKRDYYITVAVSEDSLDKAKAEALKQIREAETVGVEAVYAEHTKAWADFWEKSYVSLPEKQDYLENLWYLCLYYANSQSKGKYPANNWNGVWGAFHDHVPWNCFFHYNMQLSSFPMEAANHAELMKPYYAFRTRQLPKAQEFARNIKHSKGAFYTDVSDWKGRINPSTKDNCTCGAQIALGMYRHYRYTGDEKFLKESALPVMRGAAEFYLDQLKMAADGYYHIYSTEGYESPMFLMDDSITDLAMIRALFTALIPYLPAEEANDYRERLEKLVPYQTTEFLDDELDENGKFLRGIGKGTKPLTDRVLSTGCNPQHVEGLSDPGVEANVFGREKIRRTFGNPEHAYYGFPDTEMAPLFPAGTIGIKDKESELYKLIYNSICLHPQVISDRKSEDYGMCMGWCMMPIYLARMGLAEYLERQFEQTISTWMIYPQGFGTYGPYDPGEGNVQGSANTGFFKKNRLRNLDTGEMTTSPAWKFRHFNYETLPILATAVNEMLLQSYDGIIRLFPAIRKESEASFKLAAMDGRLVEAVYQNGECEVRIDCMRGGRMSVTAEHVNGVLSFMDAVSQTPLIVEEKDGIYSLETAAGQQILVKSQNADQISFTRNYERNIDVKVLGNSKLGTEKEY